MTVILSLRKKTVTMKALGTVRMKRVTLRRSSVKSHGSQVPVAGNPQHPPGQVSNRGWVWQVRVCCWLLQVWGEPIVSTSAWDGDWTICMYCMFCGNVFLWKYVLSVVFLMDWTLYFTSLWTSLQGFIVPGCLWTKILGWAKRRWPPPQKQLPANFKSWGACPKSYQSSKLGKQYSFPSGGGVWVKSCHNLVTARDALVTRAGKCWLHSVKPSICKHYLLSKRTRFSTHHYHTVYPTNTACCWVATP